MRYPKIPSTLFEDRRKEFAGKMVPGSMAVFYSSELMPRTGDQFYPFRQDSVLFALSGLDQPGTIVVLFPDSKKKAEREIAFILPRDPEQVIWHGERFTAQQAKSISGISTIRTINEWDTIIPPMIRKAHTVYIYPWQQQLFPSGILSPHDRLADSLKHLYPGHTFTSPIPLLRKMVMIKHPIEQDLIKKAIEVTGLAFDSVLHTLRPGMKEFEVEAELTYVLSRHGCQHAFEPIVASGKSACTLHYTINNQIINKNELVLIDFGAEYACIASDMTRTIPASGRFTKRQRDLYDSVLTVLNEVTEIMRPGITLNELNLEAGRLIERELLRLKILSKRDVRSGKSKFPPWKKYFMHGISHHLGYDVHDLHDRSAPLRPGMILTCEPGLYIPEEKIGIRLENDILVTRGKPKNLMAHIPVHPDEIESIMHAR